MDEIVVVIAVYGFMGVVWLVMFMLTLMYLSSLSRALSKCGKARRTLDPGLVWLNLIPLFHLFWKFWTASRLGESLRKEFDARGLRTSFTFGQPVGVMVPVIALCTRFIFWAGGFLAERVREEEFSILLIVVLILLGVVELVLLTIHWSQINGYTRQLAATRPAEEVTATADDGGGPREFDEDYRPIPRRRRREVD